MEPFFRPVYTRRGGRLRVDGVCLRLPPSYQTQPFPVSLHFRKTRKIPPGVSSNSPALGKTASFPMIGKILRPFSNDWKNCLEAAKDAKSTKIAGGTREESGRESTRMAFNSFPHPFNLSTLQPFNPFITQSRREAEDWERGILPAGNGWNTGGMSTIENNENRFADIERREGRGWDDGVWAGRWRGGGETEKQQKGEERQEDKQKGRRQPLRFSPAQARPFSARRYFWRRELGLFGMVYSMKRMSSKSRR